LCGVNQTSARSAQLVRQNRRARLFDQMGAKLRDQIVKRPAALDASART
jgi:hypothetical protein